MDRAMQWNRRCGHRRPVRPRRYRYEFAALLMHAEHLEAVHGVGPHTISVPRVKRADDIDPDEFGNGIDDETFAKICACLRLAVPYTGMIIRPAKARPPGKRSSGSAYPRSAGRRKPASAGTVLRTPKRKIRPSSTSATTGHWTRSSVG